MRVRQTSNKLENTGKLDSKLNNQTCEFRQNNPIVISINNCNKQNTKINTNVSRKVDLLNFSSHFVLLNLTRISIFRLLVSVFLSAISSFVSSVFWTDDTDCHSFRTKKEFFYCVSVQVGRLAFVSYILLVQKVILFNFTNTLTADTNTHARKIIRETKRNNYFRVPVIYTKKEPLNNTN